MNSTYLKNILRDIRDTKGKVISIATMVGLAAAVVVGLMLSGTTMRNTLNYSMDTYRHPDIIVRSTYGLDYEDELILKRDPDVNTMTLVKTADLMDNETLIRLKAYNNDLPKSVIVEGKMPENTDEIALDAVLMDSYKIGDELHFSYIENSRIDEEVMANLDYKLVGFFHTSDYFMEDMRELSFTAKKELDGYAYVLEDNFDTDKYGEANIVYNREAPRNLHDVAYRKFVYDKQEKIEEALANRPGEVLAGIKSDVNEELDDAQGEIDDAKKEISDAEKELADARAELDQGYIDYEKGKKEFNTEIANAKSELADARAELADGENQLQSGKAEYNRNLTNFNQEIANAEAELRQNEANLSSAQREIDNARADLDQGYRRLQNEFAGPRAELSAAKNQLDEAKRELDKNINDYNNAKAQIEAGLSELDQKAKDLDLLETQINGAVSAGNDNTNSDLDTNKINEMRAELEAGRTQVTTNKAELLTRQNELVSAIRDIEAGRAKYEAGLAEYKANKNELDSRYNEEKAKLDAASTEINARQREIDNGWASLNAGRRELEANKTSGQNQLDEALREINASRQSLDNGWAEYNEGLETLEEEKAKGEKELKDSYQDLLDGEDKYADAKREFEENRDKALDEIEEGEDEIKEGKDALLRLADPEYDIETVYDNEGINTYYQNSLNMDELTKVFPTFFYLVAMLVTLTTMKRYIDEQRTINGTLKSLGYSNKDISARFYLYGIIPTLIGSIIGAIVGRYLISNVIIHAYSSGFGNIGINYGMTIPYMIFAVVLSVALIALTVYFSSKETVSQTPASLLRPKAPNIGKKIWLERIDPIWKKMSFMQKITARNIFRYKSRMFMTLFGVGGCTALTFFGFAMIDSITETVRIEQDEIGHYDVIAMLDEVANDEDIASFNEKTKAYKTLPIRYQSANIRYEDKRRDVNIVVAEDYNKLTDFLTLRTPKGDPVSLANEDAVLTEKASKELGLAIGDSISYRLDGEVYKLPISNIVENYTGDYIYISADSFTRITGQTPIMNANYLKGDADNVIKDIEDEAAVVAIINASVIYASMDVLLANLNLVIGVITLISVMLALVVLYNLININVSERKRELATIKVLGFYPKEVTGYIFREIFILTILGILVGYVLGYAMFRYIIYVVAPEAIMLFYGVHPRPFVYSGLITIAISLVLLVVVHRKLKDIDMAEAMGSGVE